MLSTQYYGYMGSFLLAFCGLPQLIQIMETGDASGTSWMFLLMWGFGELHALKFALMKNEETNLTPLFYNYGFNIVFISIMIYYKLQTFTVSGFYEDVTKIISYVTNIV